MSKWEELIVLLIEPNTVEELRNMRNVGVRERSGSSGKRLSGDCQQHNKEPPSPGAAPTAEPGRRDERRKNI